MTDDDWTRLIGMISDIGLEVQAVDRDSGTMLLSIPAWALQPPLSTTRRYG